MQDFEVIIRVQIRANTPEEAESKVEQACLLLDDCVVEDVRPYQYPGPD